MFRTMWGNCESFSLNILHRKNSQFQDFRHINLFGSSEVLHVFYKLQNISFDVLQQLPGDVIIRKKINFFRFANAISYCN